MIGVITSPVSSHEIGMVARGMSRNSKETVDADHRARTTRNSTPRRTDGCSIRSSTGATAWFGMDAPAAVERRLGVDLGQRDLGERERLGDRLGGEHQAGARQAAR